MRWRFYLIFLILLVAPYKPGHAAPTPPNLDDLQVLSTRNVANLALIKEIRFTPWELVTAAAWSPDGQLLAVAAGERLRLYTVRDWQLQSEIRIGALTHSLSFSPQGSWLAAGSRDGRVRVWDMLAEPAQPTGELQPALVLEAHRKGVNDLAFNPQGDLLASGGNDAVARFWNLGTGKVAGVMIGGTFAVPSIAFVPDGSSLAVVNGKMVRLRQVGSERILGSFQSESPLYSVAISPDGHLVVAGDQNNQILLWEIDKAYRTGQEKYPQPTRFSGHTGKSGTFRALIWAVVFSPDGRLLASAGGDQTLRLWNVQAASPENALLTTLTAHTRAVTCVAFHPDGGGLVSGSLDGVVRVWGVMK